MMPAADDDPVVWLNREVNAWRPSTNHSTCSISYAHSDDRDGRVAALVQAIEQQYQRFAGRPLRIFFDREEIRSMDAWEQRILKGLRQFQMMVAVLSPAYLDSRQEWKAYVQPFSNRANIRSDIN
jgi:hypothetical protein